MKYFLRISVAVVVTLLIFSTWSCGKADHDTIPEVAVNISIDPNSTMYIELNSPGGLVYLTGGYKGILVYRLDNETFLAYDRACPYDPYIDTARITVDDSGLICSDTSSCGSQFLILDGSIFTGPATVGLKQYYTYYDGYLLTINN